MRPDAPALYTLKVMARTAHAAARTWTLRRYVGRLAARAGPHDYRGQLREVYRDLVLRRWRYVAEPDEWICGSARALLGYVLGARYNCRDPLRCDVVDTPWRSRGWGDCDDVATLLAAAAIALGMRPRWRIAQMPGSLHVAVEVETPTGDRVDLDPVAYPKHGVPGELPGFAWAVAGPDVLVRLVELEPAGEGDGMGRIGKRVGKRSGRRAVVVQPSAAAAHWVAVSPRDRRGPRVLAMPGQVATLFRNGRVLDGAPAVDQYGAAYCYSSNLDLWIPASDYGRLRRKRPGLVRLRRGLQRIVKGARRVIGKVLSNKWVSRIVGGALQAFGVPMPLTIAMLRAVGGVMESGGIVKLVRLARKNPREALRVLAKSVISAGRGDLLKKFGAKFSGLDREELRPCHLTQAGGNTYAAPVAMFLGLDAVRGSVVDHDDLEGDSGVYLPAETIDPRRFGDIPPTTAQPTPGSSYKVKGGDTLLEIAGRAIGVGPGAARLEYAQAIATHPANASTLRPPKNQFERDNFPNGLPSLNGRPILFMPELAPVDAPGPVAPAPGPMAPAPMPGPGPAPPQLPEPPRPGPRPLPAPAPAPGGGGGLGDFLPVAAAIGLAMFL